VSIIAVFLALAVGIVLGTAALNGPVLDTLRSNIDRLTQDKRSLETNVQKLQADVVASDDFATAVGPQLVSGTLSEQRVLLVTTPDTPGKLADRLKPLLVSAGAQVTGELKLLPALSNRDSRQVVEDLVAQVVPAGVELPKGEPYERAATELAAALGRVPGRDGINSGEAQAVVSAFQEAGLVDYSGTSQDLRQATAVVVLGRAAPQGDPNPAQVSELATLLAVAGSFDDASGGVVVAGPAGSGADNGLLKELRKDSGTARRVSGVDNADRGVGLVAVVRALAEQLRGTAGQYGTGAGSAGPLPSPAP
ncbi:MAG: copper transporter, partial [Frankiales bacterium]|nr:copper transporter [Frankiales bacterium]